MVLATDRDKKVLMFLPIPLVLAGYWYFFFRPLEQERARGAQGVASAQAKAAQLPARQAQVARLNQELDELKKRNGQLEGRWQMLAALAPDVARRTQKIERLAQLLRRHGLIVLEQGEPDGNQAGLRELEYLAKRVGEAPGGHKPLAWSVRVSGNYASLRRALHGLANGEPLAIPLNLNMKDADWDSDVREWTLLVWI